MSFSALGTGDLVLSGQLNRPTGKGTIYHHTRLADTCFANLEMPFVKEGYATEKMIALKADPIHARILHDLGVDVVTVANNHTMDYGIQGLRETIQALDSVGVAHVGGGEDVSESFAPVIKDVKGTKVAYIGVTTTLPNGSGAGTSRPGLAGVRIFTKYIVDTVTIDESPGMSPFVETSTYQPDEDLVLQSIRNAKAKADLVLVAIHWGVPYGWVAFTQSEISTYQQPLAHAMIDAGASAIFGHHPHVVHGVEVYKNAPIFYSLGNFIFSNDIVTPDQETRIYPPYVWTSLQRSVSNIGAFGRIRWTEGKISSCTIIPISIAEDGEPVEATEEDSSVLLSRLNSLSQEYGTGFELVKFINGFEINITPI
jgi:poly-gamma-glutamate capsule biosynthesis protein CapA/YwtB (metallophosphatase superfamily)